MIGIIKRKNATPFLHPVDTNAFSDYLSIVQRPICLYDIRENIGESLLFPSSIVTSLTLTLSLSEI
jgi:hypothetical protein